MSGETTNINCPNCRAALRVTRDGENPFFQCAKCGHFFEFAAKNPSAPLVIRDQPVVQSPPKSLPPKFMAPQSSSRPYSPQSTPPRPYPSQPSLAIPSEIRSRLWRWGCAVAGFFFVLIVWFSVMVSWHEVRSSHRNRAQLQAMHWERMGVAVEFDESDNITKLTFPDGQDPLLGLTMISTLPAVESIDLSGTLLSDNRRMWLILNPRITELDVSDTQITDITLREICRQNTMLKKLDMKGTGITDAGLEQLSQLTELTELGLSDTAITDEGLRHVKQLSRLKNLYLGGTMVSGEGLINLRGLRNLEVLNLRDTFVTDAGLANLRELDQMLVLYLGGTQVSDDGLSHLQGLTKLTGVNVNRTKVTQAGASYLERRLPNAYVVVDQP